jgi:hypothetical protein
VEDWRWKETSGGVEGGRGLSGVDGGRREKRRVASRTIGYTEDKKPHSLPAACNSWHDRSQDLGKWAHA